MGIVFHHIPHTHIYMIEKCSWNIDIGNYSLGLSKSLPFPEGIECLIHYFLNILKWLKIIHSIIEIIVNRSLRYSPVHLGHMGFIDTCFLDVEKILVNGFWKCSLLKIVSGTYWNIGNYSYRIWGGIGCYTTLGSGVNVPPLINFWFFLFGSPRLFIICEDIHSFQFQFHQFPIYCTTP